jgi:hypothetical protein
VQILLIVEQARQCGCTMVVKCHEHSAIRWWELGRACKGRSLKSELGDLKIQQSSVLEQETDAAATELPMITGLHVWAVIVDCQGTCKNAISICNAHRCVHSGSSADYPPFSHNPVYPLTVQYCNYCHFPSITLPKGPTLRFWKRVEVRS